MKKITEKQYKELASQMWAKVLKEKDVKKACKIRDKGVKDLMNNYEIQR